MLKYTEDLSQIVSKQFVRENLSVFFSEGLLKSYVREGRQLLFLYSEAHVVPVAITRRGIFRYANLITEPAIINAGSEESLKAFLDEVCSFLKVQMKVQWINQTSAASFFMDFPTGTKHIPFGSHVIDLRLDEDALWKNVHSKHRNVIKKAEKDGVVIECGRAAKLAEDYHRLDIDTWDRRDGKAVSSDHWKELLEEMGNDVIIYVAYLDGEPQSGAVFFFNEQMCYYMFGANKTNPHIGSGNLLQWHSILDMKSRGVKAYSFVGCRINEDENSKYHGIQRFKERFGGVLVQGYMFKMVFNPFMRGLFVLGLNIYSFLRTLKFIPFQDVIDQEIHKWPQQ